MSRWILSWKSAIVSIKCSNHEATSMIALLSIKPRFVEEILKGNKKYEFRKSIFKHPGKVEIVIIYSSSPVKKLVGAFRVGSIVRDHPRNLWNEFRESSGIDESEFFEYFKEKDNGFAIEIQDLVTFKEPVDPRMRIPDFTAPQSYRFIEQSHLKDTLQENGFVDSQLSIARFA